MEEHDELDIAMFPWLAFGHMIPFLELAKLLAQRGHKISFISTPRNIHRLPPLPPNLTPRINLVSLALPHVENLPDNAEATADLPHDKIPFLKIAFDSLQDSLFHFLQSSSPDWIIFDFAPYWLPEITAKLGISGVHFSIFNAWSISFVGPSGPAMINGDDPRTEPQHFTVPPGWVTFPSKVAFRIHEAKRCFDHTEVNSSGVTDFFRWGSVIAGCDVVAVRSCLELEADFLRLVEDLHGKPVIPVGLLLPSAQFSEGGVDEEWVTIREWLDKQAQGSVVYIAFGSELTMSQNDITELALGLELSGLPFFWTLRNGDDSIRLPDGLEERVIGRGVVWTSWAPQPRIMAHESGLIARVFEEKKVGIEVPRDEEDGSFTRNSVAESLRLVNDDKEGSAYRENAKQQMMTLFGDQNIGDRCIDQFACFLGSNRKLHAVTQQ
ncbi:UDP-GLYCOSYLTRANSFERASE 91A1-LIKE [Salix viminalis]|uniref:UDP-GLYCOSYLTRANSFERASE 91A1-LIKE n=1 Tax=Salix viminalis TaxID=40686 RepID=A0A9Q0Z451_SALVM|nr:UDP-GLYCOSYLTRANSFERASE 91A1-LIKE [Salix viminalis]